jgi:hypothetical protein
VISCPERKKLLSYAFCFFVESTSSRDDLVKELRVSEGPEVIRKSVPIFSVPHTMCAVHVKPNK